MSTQSPPNTQIRANSATSRDLHHMCLGSGHSPSPVGKAYSMCLHGRPCVWLLFAAACCYTLFYLLMMPVARLVCQRPSSNFSCFRTSLATFCSAARTPYNTVILKQLLCCTRLNVRVHSSKVELAAAGVHPVGMISSHASVYFYLKHEILGEIPIITDVYSCTGRFVRYELFRQISVCRHLRYAVVILPR